MNFSRHLLFLSIVLVASWVLTDPPLWSQENCANGIDDDGNGLIDCFDPACCDACPDHYYLDCGGSLCEINRPSNPRFDWRLLWEFSGEWDNINTPLVGRLRQSEGPVIVGLTTQEVGAGSRENIILINGETGQLQGSFPTPPMSEYATSIGLADVTSNGEGNIIIGLSEESTFSRHLECYDPDGNLVWRSDRPHGFSDEDRNATPLFADFNVDGQTEVYVGNSIFDGLTGRKLMSGNATGHQGIQEARQVGYRFFSPVAADVLPDSTCAFCEGLELIAGGQVYAVDIAGEDMVLAANIDTNVYGDGFTAINDMNADGNIDIVVAERQGEDLLIYVWNPVSEQILAEFTYSNSANTVFTGSSSVPLLTDLNGDGFTDIVFSTSLMLVALENSGAGSFFVRYEIPTQDLSGRSGPVAFDFTGDGRAEIVHRGQDLLRVINGFNGSILAETNCFSSTFLDKPVIANVDTDPQGEILVSCGNNLLAYTSNGDPWSAARPVWNQLPFFNTHIEDDLSVPANMQPIHIPETAGEFRLNRYLEQYSRPISPGPDFVFDRIEVVCENGSKFIEMTVCNTGDLRAPIQLFVAAYADNPLEVVNPPVWNVQEPIFMEAGECVELRYVFPPFGILEEAYFTLNIPPGLPFIDTTDVNSFLSPECNYQNNFELVDLSPYLLFPLDLGNDTSVCASEVEMVLLEPDTSYSNYLWSTGAMTRTITVDQSGMYRLMVTDNCGNRGSDSIRVTFSQANDMGLPPDTSLCIGDQLRFDLGNEYSQLVWLNDTGDTLCNDCNSINIDVLRENTISVFGLLNECEVQDTVQVGLLPSVSTSDTIEICFGDSIIINGNRVGAGTYTESFSSPDLCDSVVITEVIERTPIDFDITIEEACGTASNGSVIITPDNSEVDIEWFDGNTMFSRTFGVGNYAFELSDNLGCTRLDTVEIGQINWERNGWLIEQVNCFEGQDTLPNVPTSNSGRIEARLGSDSSYSWSVNGQAISDSIYIDEAPTPGVYIFEIQKANCIFTTEVEIFPPKPVQEGSPLDLFVREDDSVQLGENIDATNYEDINWTPSTYLSCDNCLPTSALPESDITYVFTAVDSNGCDFQKVYRIILEASGSIALPNVFTPNGDGINDIFELQASAPIQGIEYCRIFDRWGTLLFELRSGEGIVVSLWDGRTKDGEVVNPGVYVYSLQITDASGQLLQFTGTITVVE